MAGDELQWLEAAMGAVSKINSEDGGTGLEDARCPRCDARDFMKVADLYSESVARLQEPSAENAAVRTGGMSDAQVLARFTPPRRTSAIGISGGVAIALLAISFFIYRRFGETPGEVSVLAAIVITTIVTLTTLRSFSDRYYHRRQRWNKLYLCRQCGQLVSA